jgi:hypothetical protein
MNVVSETDVQDSEGRVVISPGLKVRHKDSQYEYTVDSVTQDEKGKHVVVLNLPEEPRFDSEPSGGAVLSDLVDRDIIYEVDPGLMIYEPENVDHSAEDVESPEAGVDFLAVPEDEFEKDYEVK